MADVKCPRVAAVIPMATCRECDYKPKDDDISSITCRYNIGRKDDTPEKEELRQMIAARTLDAEHYRKTKHTKKAEKIEREIAGYQRRLKELE